MATGKRRHGGGSDLATDGATDRGRGHRHGRTWLKEGNGGGHQAAAGNEKERGG